MPGKRTSNWALYWVTNRSTILAADPRISVNVYNVSRFMIFHDVCGDLHMIS
jgi:hypothetical protein